MILNYPITYFKKVITTKRQAIVNFLQLKKKII
jgi:hypothetical protein